MNDNALVPYSDVQRMAADVVASRLFQGITTQEAAITLMLLCQSEGLHPMQALTRYHIISGRPAMKADAMLAEFMKRGGQVQWLEWTNEACEAKFTSLGCPEGVKVRWTMEDASRAGLGRNPTWKSYPRQMLKARVASDGVRMTDPAVNQGRYTPEEVSEFEPRDKVAQAEIVAPEAPEEDLTPVLEASINAIRTKNGAGRSSREASRPSSPSGPNPPDEDSSQPAPTSPSFDREALLADAWNAIGEDERCAECNGELSGYVSQKGVPYLQCSMAHELYLEYLDKGKSRLQAGAMTNDHTYRIVP